MPIGAEASDVNAARDGFVSDRVDLLGDLGHGAEVGQHTDESIRHVHFWPGLPLLHDSQIGGVDGPPRERGAVAFQNFLHHFRDRRLVGAARRSRHFQAAADGRHLSQRRLAGALPDQTGEDGHKGYVVAIAVFLDGGQPR